MANSELLTSFSFPRRIKWSPDGTQILSASYDKNLTNFKKTDLSIIQKKLLPYNVTDFAWYPGMDENQSVTCVSAVICPKFPIFFIDTNDGHIRANYPVKHSGTDSPESLTSLAFLGSRIISGSSKRLYSNEIIRPGINADIILTCAGSILSIEPHKESAIVAIGTSLGSLSLLDSKSFEPLFSTSLFKTGIDSLIWKKDTIVMSARLDNNVIGLDIRNPSLPALFLKTSRKTSRKISLSSKDNMIAIGNEERAASIYICSENIQKIAEIGEKATPFIELNPKDDSVIAISGEFVLKESEEESSFPEYSPMVYNVMNCQIKDIKSFKE